MGTNMIYENYRCIVADPPWYMQGGGKCKCGADKHYDLLKTPDIIKVMLRASCWRPESNSHLWLWVTNNFLEDGLHVMKSLGYRYVTNMAWAKDKIGLGRYLRGQHELCLFGVRGRLSSESKSVPSLITAPRTTHSTKPDAAMKAIEQVSPGPRLEMFARTPRLGWAQWGNEL